METSRLDCSRIESVEYYPNEWTILLRRVVLQYRVRELLAVPLHACQNRNEASKRP